MAKCIGLFCMSSFMNAAGFVATTVRHPRASPDIRDAISN